MKQKLKRKIIIQGKECKELQGLLPQPIIRGFHKGEKPESEHIHDI